MDLALSFLLFLCFFLLGEAICGVWKIDFPEPGEAFVFSSALGIAAVSCATELMAFLGWVCPASAWTVLGLILAARAGKLREMARGAPYRFRAVLAARAKPALSRFELFNLCVLGVLIFMALTLAQTPPAKTDALAYHLAVPKAYLEHRGIVNLPNNIYSFFPLQFEMVYLFCLALGGENLAKLAGLGTVFIFLSALCLYYKRHLSRRNVVFVAVLFFLTPTFLELSAEAYVDLPAATFAFLAYYSWERWRTAGRDGWFFLMTVFTGFAVAAKMLSVILVPAGLLGIAWIGRERKKNLWTLGSAAVFLAGVALFLLPWWARNYHYSGNPFVPLFAEALPLNGRINWDAGRSSQFFQYVHSFGMGRGVKEFLWLPVNLTFLAEKDSLRFDGNIGLLYFLLLPAVFFIGPRKPAARPIAVRAVSLFFVFLIFWFFHSQYIRFLGPAFAFLTLVLAYGLDNAAAPPPPAPLGRASRWPRSGVVLKKALPLLAVAGIAYNLYLDATYWLRVKPLPYLMGMENREEYLLRELPVYSLYRAFNRSLSEDDRALFVYMRNFGYLCEKKFISDSVFEARTLQSVLEPGVSPDGIAGRLRALGVTHLMFDNRFVFGKDSAFSPDQLELLRNFLNARARLVAGKNGFYLYRFVIN